MPKKEYTEAFRLELVDEAMNRTPAGGFPELEKRHGLPPGTLFDWVEELGPALPPRPFSGHHVWIGDTALDFDAFHRYFDNDPNYWEIDEEALERADHDLTGCGFCRDLGRKHLYDEDLLLVAVEPAAIPVAEMILKAALRSDASVAAIARECERRGITAANAMFVYSDPGEPIADRDKRYNGLFYLGLFPDE